MKILRLISYIVLGLILVSLVLGNIFYLQVKKFVDQNYIAINVDENEISRFKYPTNPDYTLTIFSDKSVYNQFEKIKVYGRILKRNDNSILENSVIEAEFYLNGQKQKNLNGNEKIKLIYNSAQKLWIGYWYPENTDVSGNIEINAYGYVDKPEPSVQAKNNFYITGVSTRYSLKKGTAFLGIDSLERISKRNILSAEGKEVDWNYIPEWLNMVSADGILMLGGITETYQEDINIESPWYNDKINETTSLAEKVKQKGKNFGSWIKGLKVEGIYIKKMGYKPVLSFKDDKYNEDPTTISLSDENRKRNIIKLFSSFMDNDNFSYVGISDLFLLPEQGIELMDRFLQEFQISVPDNWAAMDADSKYKYFLTKMKDKQLNNNFIIWKEYIISEYIKDIIDKSGHKKPIFYYADYQDIIDNPDLISIVLNSGIDFIVLNFNVTFDNIAGHVDEINKISKISRYFNKVIVSYTIDYQNTDMKDFENSAIENYVNANMQLVKYGSDVLNANGIMINDLYKAMFGKRGPYSPYDWMLGAGELIYQFKEMNKVIPLSIDIHLPQAASFGQDFMTEIKIVNNSPKSVGNFKLEFLPVSGKTSQRSTAINIIQPGKEIILNIPFQLDTNSSQFVRKKSLIGIHVSWSEGNTENFGSTGYTLFGALNLLQGSTTNSSDTNKK